jgi:hypothetical protein
MPSSGQSKGLNCRSKVLGGPRWSYNFYSRFSGQNGRSQRLELNNLTNAEHIQMLPRYNGGCWRNIKPKLRYNTMQRFIITK